MKSDVIAVSARYDSIAAALDLAEKVAAYRELSEKSALHLRLLTEEVMGMVRAVAGGLHGRFWIEADEDAFSLHLTAETDLDEEQRKQLISAATSGKNEATRGLMGKIRAFFEPCGGAPALYTMDMIDTTSGAYASMVWSMRAYEQQVRQRMEEKREGAAEAWDELEKAVISKVADDVKVSIRGRSVEMIVCKRMK